MTEGVIDRATFRQALLAWYDAHKRTLAWRSDRPDPYRVWLSEIMLQQTTVPHATPYFLQFTRRWPTVADLAAAGDADVMAAWAGLGYYARARNLLACARAVAERHGGVFPDTEEGLRGLPGLGPYTAAAVGAIAFGQRSLHEPCVWHAWQPTSPATARSLSRCCTSRTSFTSVHARFNAAGPRNSGRHATTSHDA